MRAILYIRVSTLEQASEGVSLDAQESRLVAYCTMRGIEVVDVVRDEGVSAGKALDSRPGGSRVVAAVRNKAVDAVVAYKLDRLFRDASDCLSVTRAWDDAGVALHLVDLGGQTLDTGSAMGRFFLTVMAGAAELERNLVAERTVSALAHKRSKAERTGYIPYGAKLADDGVRLLDCPDELATLGRMRELRTEGRSLRVVAKTLTAEGRLNRKGKAWSHVAVSNQLKAEKGPRAAA